MLASTTKFSKQESLGDLNRITEHSCENTLDLIHQNEEQQPLISYKDEALPKQQEEAIKQQLRQFCEGSLRDNNN